MTIIIGIGDLHSEWARLDIVLDEATYSHKEARIVVLSGDLSNAIHKNGRGKRFAYEKAAWKKEIEIGFARIAPKYPDHVFFFVLGNHDPTFEDYTLLDVKLPPNVRCIDHTVEVLEIDGQKVAIGGFGGAHWQFGWPGEWDNNTLPSGWYKTYSLFEATPADRKIFISHTPTPGAPCRTKRSGEEIYAAFMDGLDTIADVIFCGHIHEARGQHKNKVNLGSLGEPYRWLGFYVWSMVCEGESVEYFIECEDPREWRGWAGIDIAGSLIITKREGTFEDAQKYFEELPWGMYWIEHGQYFWAPIEEVLEHYKPYAKEKLHRYFDQATWDGRKSLEGCDALCIGDWKKGEKADFPLN